MTVSAGILLRAAPSPASRRPAARAPGRARRRCIIGVDEPAKSHAHERGSTRARPPRARHVTKSAVDDARLLGLAREVLEIEAVAVQRLAPRLGSEFLRACHLCLQCRGRIIVTGMGKSGHIAHKIAATLASTGSPSFFLHPAEASHGDAGMITRDDVVVAVSNSGETPEIAAILPVIKRLGVPLIAMTGNPASTLARTAEIVLDVGIETEACPLQLAPTASTTATLAMGDALALALSEARGFTAEDFARSHPAGSLGRRLLLHVADVMHTGGQVPKVARETRLSDALVEMTRKGFGMTAVVAPGDRLLGVFTDGDLRRALDHRVDLHETVVERVMTPDPKTVPPNVLAAEAVHVLEQYKITALLVVDDGRLVGVLNVHDLFRAGVM
jgi:arabinose-5-phosphate isomerase